MSSDNPGTNMAAAVDAEIAKFRQIQTDMSKLQTDLQTILTQQSENEMVKQELDLLDSSSANVYKLVGPILLRNDLEDAQQTVAKRLEFISGERQKLEKAIEDKEKKANETAAKVQDLQALMQRATAEAVRSITEIHGASS
jgi:prefoldin beta subunit